MAWPKGKPRSKRQPVMKEAGTISLSDDTKSKRTPVPASEEAMTPKINKAIDQVVAAIRKKFGEDAIYRFDERDEDVIGVFSSGVKEVDDMIGIGGFPLAKLIQISGPESVGKSSFCKWLIGQAQAQGVICYFIDTELSPDSVERAKAYGVDVHSLIWSEFMYLEDAFEAAALAIDKMKNSDTPVLIFIDSIAAASMKSSAERDFDEPGRRAEKASFLSANLGKLVQPLKGTKIGIVFVNQMRSTANAMPFQDPNYEPGGRALAHWCHLTIRMSRLGQIKVKQEVVGIKARLKVKKSKIAVPFKQSEIAIMFDGEIAALSDGVSVDED